MNLANELCSAGIQWSIRRVSSADAFAYEMRDKYDPRDGSLVTLTYTLIRPDSIASGPRAPQCRAKRYRSDSSTRVNTLLAYALRDLMPEHPFRREYLDAIGNTHVTIDPQFLGESEECLGSLAHIIHVQLRKCVDSKQSVIQWNAVHHLLQADWDHILKNIRSEVTQLQAGIQKKVASGKRAFLLRRDVGLAIRNAMTEKMREVTHRDFDKNNASPERTELQKFALLTFESANWLTEEEDWVFGWTGFLCEDAEPVLAAPVGLEAAP